MQVAYDETAGVTTVSAIEDRVYISGADDREETEVNEGKQVTVDQNGTGAVVYFRVRKHRA